MKITYIHHSSFCVELENSILLFDYFKGELPEFNKDKKLYVFASHFHQDHFDKCIFVKRYLFGILINVYCKKGILFKSESS